MKKKELRSAFKEKRKELSPGKLSSLSEEILERTLATFQLEKKVVSIFLPIERQRENNTN
jgi:5-formyltetrahydrofolate cyclo-ligase